MRESIVKQFPKTEFSITIVWIRILPGDCEAAAQEKSVIFEDPRVRQFYDPDQRSGKAVAESLGYDGKVAWDIYLFYAAGGKWIQDPPVPNYWMHQISETWADRKHFHTGDDLVRELSFAAKKVADHQRGPVCPSCAGKAYHEFGKT